MINTHNKKDIHTSNITNKTIAEFFRLCLISLLIDNETIINWTDRIISNEDNPDPVFLDISSGVYLNINEMSELLQNIKGEADNELVFRLFLCKLSDVMNRRDRKLKEIMSLVHTAGLNLFYKREKIYNSQLEEMIYFEAYLEVIRKGDIRERLPNSILKQIHIDRTQSVREKDLEGLFVSKLANYGIFNPILRKILW